MCIYACAAWSCALGCLLSVCIRASFSVMCGTIDDNEEVGVRLVADV